MSDIHKKLGVKKGGKPGDLMAAFNAKKAAGVFAKRKAKKHEKVMHCATCKKSHAKGKHEKKSAKKEKKHSKAGPQMSPASNGNLGGVPGQYKKKGKKEKKS